MISKAKYMKKKKCQKRRYFLHQRIKEFATYNAKNRSVIESPSEIKLHRVPGSRPFAISYYQDNDEKKLITKCFSQKFQYVGKLSKQKGHKLSKKLNKNFDYHIIIF